MKLKYSVLLISILFVGCSTIQLPKGPDMYMAVQAGDKPQLGISKASDLRESQKAGTIGAAGFKVGEDISALLTSHLFNDIGRTLNVNVAHVPLPESADVKAFIEENRLDGLLVPTIKRIKIFSADSLMQPVETELEVTYKLYKPGGELAFEQTFIGAHSKRIGLVMGTKTLGEYVEFAAKDSIAKLRNDTQFQQSIANLKA